MDHYKATLPEAADRAEHMAAAVAKIDRHCATSGDLTRRAQMLRSLANGQPITVEDKMLLDTTAADIEWLMNELFLIPGVLVLTWSPEED